MIVTTGRSQAKFTEGYFDLQGALPAVPPSVDLHPGYFNETVGPFMRTQDKALAFASIDCDLYSSTQQVSARRGVLLRAGRWVQHGSERLHMVQVLEAWCGGTVLFFGQFDVFVNVAVVRNMVQVLEAVACYLVPGTVLYFDEFMGYDNWWATGEARAWFEAEQSGGGVEVEWLGYSVMQVLGALFV